MGVEDDGVGSDCKLTLEEENKELRQEILSLKRTLRALSTFIYLKIKVHPSN